MPRERVLNLMVFLTEGCRPSRRRGERGVSATFLKVDGIPRALGDRDAAGGPTTATLNVLRKSARLVLRGDRDDTRGMIGFQCDDGRVHK